MTAEHCQSADGSDMLQTEYPQALPKTGPHPRVSNALRIPPSSSSDWFRIEAINLHLFVDFRFPPSVRMLKRVLCYRSSITGVPMYGANQFILLLNVS